MGRRILPIPGKPGYFVSNDGKVYSCKRHGTAPNDAPLREMKTRDSNGYRTLLLWDGTRYEICGVHALMLLAFSGACPEGMETRHLNGKRSDNRTGNLKYGTRLENAADRELHGTVARGEKNGFSSLTETEVIQIRSLASAGKSFVEIARKFGISDVHAGYVAKGILWKHLPGAIDGRLQSRTKISTELIRRMIAMRKSGLGIREISRRIGVGSGYVSKIISGKARKNDVA